MITPDYTALQESIGEASNIIVKANNDLSLKYRLLLKRSRLLVTTAAVWRLL